MNWDDDGFDSEAERWMATGQAKVEAGDLTGAITDFERVIEWEPTG